MSVTAGCVDKKLLAKINLKGDHTMSVMCSQLISVATEWPKKVCYFRFKSQLQELLDDKLHPSL